MAAAIAKTLIPRNLEPEPLQPIALPEGAPAALPTVRPEATLPDIRMPEAPIQPIMQQAKPQVVQPSYDQQRLEKIHMQQQPYDWSKHNLGGKIAHVLSVAGNIAGDIFAPNVMARIPGTQANREAEENALTERISTEKQREAQEQQQQATAKHLNVESQELPDNSASTRALQGAQVSKINDELAQGPSLATAYAHRVNQVIKEGGDPSADPTVMHLQDAITNLQRESAPKSLMQSQPILLNGKPHTFMLDPLTGEKKVDLGEHYERPMSISLTSPGDNADLIKGIGEYRIAPPNSRTAQGAAILREVAKQYPGYDASQYESQVANRKYFTSGKGGAVINALNTVSKHLDDAEKNMPNNTSIPLLNKGKNIALSAIGEAPTKKWDIDADAIGGEWSKLVSGGVATEGELNHIKGLLNNADSPKAMAQAIAEIRELTNGKLAGIQQQIGSGQLDVPSRPISSLPGSSTTGMMRARDPQGVLHEAPVGTPLPKGWKAE